MTKYIVLSPLDVLLAAQIAGLEHSIVRITEAGVACDRCHRLLDAVAWAEPCVPVAWAEPCVPVLDPVPGAQYLPVPALDPEP